MGKNVTVRNDTMVLPRALRDSNTFLMALGSNRILNG